MFYNATCAATSSGGATSMLLTGLVTSLIDGACNLANPSNYPPDRGDETLPCVFDFIVIGSGISGCVLAGKLTEDPDITVAVLHAGDDPTSDSAIPGNALKSQLTMNSWDFDLDPQYNAQFGLKKQRMTWRQSKMLGGSSTLNSMSYDRGIQRDYDNWAAQGNLGWSFADVLRSFMASEDFQVPELMQSPNHGRHGPLPVSYFQNDNTPLHEGLLQAASEMNMPRIMQNTEENSGFFRVHTTIVNGIRFNVADAFLGPAKNRENLYMIKNSLPVRIIVKDNRAVGVEYVRNGVQNIINAKKEVILSGGATKSPQILMLSGIGPQDHLQAHNIDVVHDLPGVGKNLQSRIRCFGLTASIAPLPAADSLDTANYLLKRQGQLASLGLRSVAGRISSDNEKDHPNIGISFLGPFSEQAGDSGYVSDIVGMKDEYKDYLTKPCVKGRNIFHMIPSVLRPKSLGEITLRNSNPFSSPKISTNIFDNKEDLNAMTYALSWSEKFLRSNALEKFDLKLSDEPMPGCEREKMCSEEYWECVAKATTTTYLFNAGTCKMGPPTDIMSVVDHKLRVYGVKGLRVVDSSIMPTLPSGNKVAPVTMIGQKAAAFIKEDWNIR